MNTQILFIHLLFPSITIWYTLSAGIENNNSDDITGIWLMANKNVKVEVYKNENLYYGKVIWMGEEANKANFKVGDIIIDKMQYNSHKQIYEGGNFYGRGYRFKCELKLVRTDMIKVRISKGALYKERFCTRINN